MTAAPLTPPTCDALAAAEGMTREAFRVRVEWRALLTFTRLMDEAAEVALDPGTGRLLPEVSHRLQMLRQQRLQCVLALLSYGVPGVIIQSVIH